MKRNEPITSIMTKDVRTAHLGNSLSDVRMMLAEGLFHHVPIVSGEKLIGLVSSTDILRVGYGTTASEIDSTLDHTARLEDVMQKMPITISSTGTVREAAEKLANGHFHSLAVVEEDDKLVGMVTSTDLITYLLSQY